ncbi:tyrosine-protein phosphatase non-receptor type 20 [Phyllostomus discolor]|uniref:Tyrosine-protein phosphatase non-receptor type 20 n=1 Tax=Phyllostomus discolor TaxID=89673 RepID=A0A7E6DXD5_9CHIR|nr:tyrosine-protein phosphatase non-receptor type 20 [Phyllostomus discolor]
MSQSASSHLATLSAILPLVHSSPLSRFTSPSSLGKDQKGDDSNMEDLNFWKTLPSSSQRKMPRSKVFANEVNSEKGKFSLQDLQHSDYEDFFKEPTKSESEHSIWTASGSFLRDKWNSEDELAGPSQTVSPHLHDSIQIVSERELAQLAQVQPLIFSFHEKSAIKDCFKMLQKKVEEHEIIQEFMVNILVLTKELPVPIYRPVVPSWQLRVTEELLKCEGFKALSINIL